MGKWEMRNEGIENEGMGNEGMGKWGEMGTVGCMQVACQDGGGRYTIMFHRNDLARGLHTRF